MKKETIRETYRIIDIDCDVIIENVTRKEALSWLDEFIENYEFDWCDLSDDSYEILYNDGSRDYINEDYDGHKIKRVNIASIVFNNAETAIVYGGYEINEYGVVSASFEKLIACENIEKIA